jgi:TonB family protein
LPQVTGIDVPNVLPPAEASSGMPDPGLDRRPLVIGDRAGIGPVRAPGGVVDNRMAEKPAIPLEGNLQPAYPSALRSAGLEGEVEVEFVIDPSGRVRSGSLRILRGDHALFVRAVREALSGHRFLPAEAGGVRVAVLVRQRFVFSLDA